MSMIFSQKTSRNTMTQTTPKERLFDSFYHAALHTMEALELQYDVSGVVNQVFGEKDGLDPETKSRFEKSRPWQRLMELYDYAVNGIEPSDDPISVVTDGSDIIKIASSEDYWPSEEWDEIIATGDGRFALDDGLPIELDKIALLANVDVRTVRNAISSGDLSATKESGVVFVDNASARKWLLGRKGFKPTVSRQISTPRNLMDIGTPSSFGVFLRSRRSALNIQHSPLLSAQGVTPDDLSELEAGVFSIPLNMTFPVADFYQINRSDFLNTVMRIFFPEELAVLQTHQAQAETE
ncbi:MAG: hypothetical protein RJQ21_12110 [Rhodospirillales bacterium]